MKKLLLLQTLAVAIMLAACTGCKSDNNDDDNDKQGSLLPANLDSVDLGLSVYWANVNVGGNAAEDYGEFFAWGETAQKDEYTDTTYSYFDITKQKFTNLGNNISGTKYDVARARWGGKWRMPTSDEMNELIKNCKWEMAVKSGTNVYKVTGKNGKVIYLPAGGYVRGKLWHNRGSYGMYRSSTYDQEHEPGAYYMIFSADTIAVYSSYRSMGMNVRPVMDKTTN
jgi:hypothetical protein